MDGTGRATGNIFIERFWRTIKYEYVCIKLLAVIIYRMIKDQVRYNTPEDYLFLDQKRKQMSEMSKKIPKFGIEPNDLALFTRPEYAVNYEKQTTDNQDFTEHLL